jgi:hypothetical protein
MTTKFHLHFPTLPQFLRRHPPLLDHLLPRPLLQLLGKFHILRIPALPHPPRPRLRYTLEILPAMLGLELLACEREQRCVRPLIGIDIQPQEM